MRTGVGIYSSQRCNPSSLSDGKRRKRSRPGTLVRLGTGHECLGSGRNDVAQCKFGW